MSCPYQKRFFMPFGHAKVFNTLDLHFGYHSLPLKEGDKVNMTFWGIDYHGKDCLYQWRFLPFGLKNILTTSFLGGVWKI
jgi:hypothetical protein